MAGAVFGEAQVSLFVAGAVLGVLLAQCFVVHCRSWRREKKHAVAMEREQIQLIPRCPEIVHRPRVADRIQHDRSSHMYI